MPKVLVPSRSICGQVHLRGKVVIEGAIRSRLCWGAHDAALQQPFS